MIESTDDVKDSAADLQSHAKSAAKSLKDAANGAASRVAAQASDAWSNAKEAGRRAGSVAGEQYDRLAQRAQAAYGQGRDTAVEWEESFEGFVQRKPLTAVLAGVGVGLALGLILSRRD